MPPEQSPQIRGFEQKQRECKRKPKAFGRRDQQGAAAGHSLQEACTSQ